MLESDRSQEDFGGLSDRRIHPRQEVRALSCVELGKDNGGIVLNLSEGGLALQAVAILAQDQLLHVRFHLAQSRQWLETSGRVTWTNESRKVAGVEFLKLPDAARRQIKEWSSLETSLPFAEFKESEALASAKEAKVIRSTDAVESSTLIPEDFPEAAIASLALKESAPAASAPAKRATLSSSPRSAAATRPRLEVVLSDGATQGLRKQAPKKLETPSRNRGLVIALFASLAVAALIVGWAARWGGSKQAPARINTGTPGNVLIETPEGISSASPGAKTSEIEITDLNNHSLFIPFEGPIGTPDSPAVQEVIEQRRGPGEKTIEVGTPSPAVGAQNSSTAGAAKEENSLQLTNVPSESANAVPTSGASEARSSIPPSPAPSLETPPQHDETIQSGRLISRVEPQYPASALEKHIEGTVKLHAVIDRDGSIKTLESVSGPGSLIDAAMNAIRQWRYTPTLLDGQPVETEQDIFVSFRTRGRTRSVEVWEDTSQLSGLGTK